MKFFRNDFQKLAPEMTVTDTSLSYKGGGQKLVTGTAKGGTLVYSLRENGDYSEKIPTGKDVVNVFFIFILYHNWADSAMASAFF